MQIRAKQEGQDAVFAALCLWGDGGCSMPERESFRWKSKYLEDLSRGVKETLGENEGGTREKAVGKGRQR